jgi:hypothetical protein
MSRTPYTSGVQLIGRLAVFTACCAGVLAPLASAQPPGADLLSRIHAYVETFQRELPSIVAEEHYVQVATNTGAQSADAIESGRLDTLASGKRVLRSDVLMVTVPGTSGWVLFRDVFEVDGQRVRDREDRLLALLQSPDADTVAQARRLATESARYNIGRVQRTTNLPDSGFLYLKAASASRMTFEPPRAAARLDGAETAVIRFRETSRPTIITSLRGSNVPASGQVWAHAATGAIVKIEFKLSDMSTDGVFVVEFALDQVSGLRLPLKMTERYTSPNEDVRGTAQYSNVRRFNVSTDEKLRTPPGGGS